MATTAAVTAPGVVSGTTPTSSSSSNSSLNSTTGTTLAGNFQTFLMLLTTQLQNQSPLDPLDTNQFTQQLVQFAQVEQQLKTNEELKTLVAMQQAVQATQALGFVGKTAVVDGSTTALSNSKATWELNIKSASTVNITITNSSGQTVFTGKYSANAGDSQPFTWNGQGNDGTQLPDGKYTLTASAVDSSGTSVGVATQIQGTVSSVDLTQSPPLLMINGQSYTVSQVKAIVG
ncbi:MAG: flagellar biosynthesis protein FlgD [Bradyrhizobium sp.]|uniref:flagellar hook assembly protein FlgD n=1 Tax=Bradyrhizobium sp. TaxID=376 RepID=UPI0025BFBAA9|nr:flagellar hook capping FlgD N-terminal domain-containing protein [Bradyrhizobium sp.]MBI5265257.1 flagellar biosynthesis protein FlgD [Bradyrhizobium sp.]